MPFVNWYDSCIAAHIICIMNSGHICVEFIIHGEMKMLGNMELGAHISTVGCIEIPAIDKSNIFRMNLVRIRFACFSNDYLA